MPQRSPDRVALDFLREWEEGKAPTLQEYIARYGGDAREMVDLVADYLMLDALASPAPATAATGH